jgi:fimbrial isopeptide formation D2 family protein/uncharacterized repeat protein (TIGR01451 family)
MNQLISGASEPLMSKHLLAANNTIPYRYGRLLGSLALSLCALSSWMQPVNAEGSRELVKNGGDRPFTEWKTNTTGGILRRTVLKVYANKDEVINLGSSAVGVGQGDILLFDGTDNVDIIGTQKLKCSTDQAGKGILKSRAEEIAGPAPTSGGYKPCTYTAPTSGVYKVVFYGPDGTGFANDPKIVVNTNYITNPLTTAEQNSTVSMWDITVRSSATSTIDINGRVFTDYIALVMGANSRYLKSNLYILTDDGYRYSTDLSVGSGLDPNGFLFFANGKGLLAPGGQPLYRSGQKAGDNTMTPPLNGNVTIQPPKYPVFFNPPDNNAVSGLGVSLTALPPSPPTNFLFTGGTGGSGNQTPQSVGGTFSFNAPQAGGYQIIIDANNDGLYNNTPVLVNGILISDRILEGSVVNQGFGTAAWDGKDGTATNPVVLTPRPSNAPYNAKIILKGGEYHFPLIDAESGKDGFKIQMLNPPGVFSNGASTTTIYFDERDYTVSGTNVTLNCSAANGLPICDARSGVDSTLGAHKYGTNTGSATDYGDKKALDTWIYFPSDAVLTPLVITTTNKANVQGKKSVKFLTDTDSSGTVTVGDKVEYTITYSNATPAATSDATNFVINDTLPSQLTFVSGAIASPPSSGTINYKSSYNGSGALTNNTGTLKIGESITIKIVATINSENSGASISNQATATFNTPDNPATTGTVVTDADSAGASKNPPTVNNYFFQKLDDGINSGNDPSNPGDDDPTLITVGKPNLRLVKRISNISGVDITGFNDLTTGVNAADDNAPGWISSSYLQGAFDTSQIPVANRPKPKDEMEYTIYFLADATANSQNVKICDFIPNNTSYVPGSLQLKIGTAAAIPITDVVGGADMDGGFYATAPFPSACVSTYDNGKGAVLVNVGTLNFSTAAGTPTNSYGYIRFRATVK